MMLLAFLIGCLISWFIRCVLMGSATTDVSSTVATAPEKVASTTTAKSTTAKSAPKKATPKKVTSKKAAPKKAASAAKTSKPAAKKAVAKKPTAKKPATKKPTAKKPASSGKPAALKAARAGKKDDLKRIKGIGPKIETTLNKLGIFHFDQIAGWNRAAINWVDDDLSFHGRIDREKWISQAKTLAKGGDTAFSRRVKKGAVPSSK